MNKKKSRTYILILSGPSASGKSTLADALWKTLPGYPAHLCLDTLKHMVFRATSTDHYLDLASLNALSLAKNFLDAGHSVIVNKAFGKYAFVEPFIKEGSRRCIPVYYFKLTAPLKVLLQRNRSRSHRLPEWSVKTIYLFHQAHAHHQGTQINTAYKTVPTTVSYIRRAMRYGQRQKRRNQKA